MENGEKIFSLTAAAAKSTLKMPQAECMIPPVVATASKPNPNQSNFYEFQQHQTHQQQQQQQHYINSGATTHDPFATYTDNFDLSLLPQDCANNATTVIKTNSSSSSQDDKLATPIDNIPTTVFNFENKPEIQTPPPLSAVPEIKIEQTWSSCPALNTIKQEQSYHSYFPFSNKQNQLIPPPPAYPLHIYPSPQSSPVQSEYGYPQTHFSAACYAESLNSSRNSIYTASATSPCPPFDLNSIKQEQLHILPPSPPESSCDTPTPQSSYSISGFDFKSEPFESDVENSPKSISPPSANVSSLTLLTINNAVVQQQQQQQRQQTDHQVLRECLADTSFQKQHNLKPLALDSFIGGLAEVRDNFEPVISLALEHAKREADATCAKLQISQNPSNWSTTQVHAWLQSTLQQFELPAIDGLEGKFNENGAALLQLSEEEFIRRIPEGGSMLHAQLEIWKLTYSDDMPSKPLNDNCMETNNWNENRMTTVPLKDEMEDDTEDEDDFLSNTNNASNGFINANTDCNNTTYNFVSNANVATNTTNPSAAELQQQTAVPIKRSTGTRNGSHIHLWQFLKELLASPQINGTAIRWIDRTKGIFKIEDSVRVAKLWGKRKNRPAMNYDKLSRSIRQYYKKGIMKKTERSQRLVYQFCQPYHI